MTITISTQVLWFIIGFVSSTLFWWGLFITVAKFWGKEKEKK